MTANLSSKKTNNILINPNVSLLVHECKTLITSACRNSKGCYTNICLLGVSQRLPERRDSLASLLLSMNAHEMGKISATINGTARLLAPGSDEESYYRTQHLEKVAANSEGMNMSNRREESPVEGGGRAASVAPDGMQVILVELKSIRASDWKGCVRDWVLTPSRPPYANGAL